MILGYHALHAAFRPGGTWKAFIGNSQITNSALKINPNSIDVSLGNKFLFPAIKNGIIDPYDPSTMEWAEIIKEDIVLEPKEYCLGFVRERFETTARFDSKHFVQQYEGRSTVGRLFLATHVTAGFGDYGFSGAFTLELVNHNERPIKLYAGMRIGQVYWTEVESPKEYTGSYSINHNNGPVAPILGADRF